MLLLFLFWERETNTDFVLWEVLFLTVWKVPSFYGELSVVYSFLMYNELCKFRMLNFCFSNKHNELLEINTDNFLQKTIQLLLKICLKHSKQ